MTKRELEAVVMGLQARISGAASLPSAAATAPATTTPIQDWVVDARAAQKVTKAPKPQPVAVKPHWVVVPHMFQPDSKTNIPGFRIVKMFGNEPASGKAGRGKFITANEAQAIVASLK